MKPSCSMDGISLALTGKTIGDLQFRPQDQIPDRFTAMHICTSGSSWCTGEETLKGKIVKGIYAS